MVSLRRLTMGFLAITLLASINPPSAHAQSPAPCAVAAAAALAQRGHAYIWGSKGPGSFDCSGLVYWSWLQAGVNVGLSTYDQARQGISIPCSLSDLAGSATTCWEAGDLIFLAYTGGQHVAMYIGNGLFADAYNGTTGVIIHNPAADSFYQRHYWQSRRIVSCNGVTVNPGASSTPVSTPELEDIPNLIAPVSFSIPQCGACNSDGSTLLPATSWDGQWPSGTEWLNVGQVFQTVIGWLAWRIGEIIRVLICWLLSMLAQLAGILAALTNAIIGGINGLWKILIFLWLSLQAWFVAGYELLIDIWTAIIGLLDTVRQLLSLILLIISVGIDLIGRVLSMLGLIVGSILGLLGWVGGMSIGMFQAILIALSGTTVPTQLTDTYTIYRLLRGALEGLRDSAFGWVLYLTWAMCYIAFVFWASRYFSEGK